MKKYRFFALFLSAVLAIFEIPISEIYAADREEEISTEGSVDVILTLSEPSILESYVTKDAQKMDFSTYCKRQTKEKEVLEQEIKAVKEKVQDICKKDGVENQLKISRTFDTICTALAITVPRQELDEIRKIDGVTNLIFNETYRQVSTEQEEKKVDAVMEEATAAVKTDSPVQTGRNMAIAILDTGIYAAHEAFQDVPQDAKYNVTSMQNLLKQEELLCVQQYPDTLTAEKDGGEDSVYKSEKIPFVYNYAENNTDCTPQNAHGTQMAGIAAGSCTKYQGMAEDAQLFSMQIYNKKNETSDIYLLTALQDAVYLNADVICLNAGTEGGDSTAHDSFLEQVYQTIEKSGITLIAGAGDQQEQQRKKKSTMQIDTATIGKNAANKAVISVASQKKGGQISAFSAGGPTSDMELKPDITTVGEQLNAPTISETMQSYQKVSGTDFAAAQVAGAAAVLKADLIAEKEEEQEDENVEEQPLTVAEKKSIAQQLNGRLFSTAKPLQDEKTGIYTSVKRQGCGTMQLQKALEHTTYLMVKGKNRPEASLGYGTDGMYSFQVIIYNRAEYEQTYQLFSTVQAEKAEKDEKGNDIQTQIQQNLLNQGAFVSFSGKNVVDNEITVAPNRSQTVKMTLRIKDNATQIQKLQEQWLAGFYVEGYFFAEAEDGECVSLPYLGFYGDFSYAPLFDGEKDCKVFDGNYLSPTADGNVHYGTNLFQQTIQTKTVQEKTKVLNQSEKKQVPIMLSRNSANKAAVAVYSNTFLLRGAASLTYQMTDTAGEEIQAYTVKKIPRTVEPEANSRPISVEEGLGDYERYYFNCTDIENKTLSDGGYTLTIHGKPAGVQKETENLHKLTYQIILDNTNPKVEKEKTYLYEKDDEVFLHMSASDNQYLSGYQLCARNAQGKEDVLVSCVLPEKKKADSSVSLGNTQEFFAAGYAANGLTLNVYDGALNRISASVTFQSENPGEVPEKPIKTTLKLKKKKNGDMELSWKKRKEMTGYMIYRSTAQNGNYKKIGTTKKTKFTDKTNLVYQKKYYYKVRPYRLNGNKKTYGADSNIVNAICTVLRAPELCFSVVDETHLFFAWNRVSKAVRYELYRSTDNGNFEKVRTLKNERLVNTTEQVKPYTLYYYKLRVVVKINGKTKKSQFSNEVSCLTGKIEG